MNELVKYENDEIVVNQNAIDKIIEFNKLKKEMEYQMKLINDGLMNLMNEKGIKKFITKGLSATIKDGSTRTTIDTKRLKEECPEIYGAYSKTSEVKPSLILTVAD